MFEVLGRLPGGSDSHGGAPAPIAPSQPLLAQGRVRYVGEPVALVVAETRAAAGDGAERVEVAYWPLPAVAFSKISSSSASSALRS